MSLCGNLNIGACPYQSAEINDVIKDVLSYYDKQHNIPEFDKISGFEAAGRSIRGLFGQYCHCNNGIVLPFVEPNEKFPSSPNSHTCLIPLTRERIFTRLTVLDSLFSTNLNKGYYIKQYITEEIWKACDDGKGGHSDAVLANKASSYIDWVINQYTPTPQQQKEIAEIEDLIYGRYPWVKKAEDHKQTALSIMTKYLHYLVEAVRPHNTKGFPIYDSLVVDMLPKVYAYVTGKNIAIDFPCATTIDLSFQPYADYVRALWKIIEQLKKANHAADVWNDPMRDMTDFHILDLFMWHLGKVSNAKGQYDKLWMPTTPEEFENMLNSGQIAPHLKSLEDLADKIAAHYVTLQNKWATNATRMTTQDSFQPHPFSVAHGKQVVFSVGNLQCLPTNHLQRRFAEHQYDICVNKDLDRAGYKNYQEWTDLFPFSITTLLVTENDPWRVLTEEEWKYLFTGRERYGKSFKCTITTNEGDVKGVVLLPDDWEPAKWRKFYSWVPNTSSDACNKYYRTLEEWTALESFGAVFLPATRWEDCNAGATWAKGNAIAYWSASMKATEPELEPLHKLLPQMRQARALHISAEYSGAATPEYICDWDANSGLLPVRFVKDIEE